MCIIPTFFCSVQTFCSLDPRAFSLFDINVKKLKDTGDKFGPYAFVQDLCLLKGQGSHFDYGLFGKLVP